MLTAFFLDDVLHKKIDQNSVFSSNPAQDGNYVENVSDPRPGVPWVAGEDFPGATGAAQFSIIDSNKFIDLSEGPSSSITTLTIPTGYFTGAALAAKISDALTSAGSPWSTWICTYGPSGHNPAVAQGKFYIGNQLGSFNAMVLRFGTGPNAANSMAGTLGFHKEDTADATQHVSEEYRYSNHTWLVFDLGAGGEKINAFMCDLETDDPTYTVDTSTVKMYGQNSSSVSGGQLQYWIGAAAKTLNFSVTPSYSENKVKVAFDTSGATMVYRYWLFSWYHEDEIQRHKVNLAKGFVQVSSTTRTIQTLRGHGLLNPAPPLSKANYYPVNQLRNWRVPLSFDAWNSTDYRQVIHRVVRFGKQKGILWALRWDDIVSGAVTAQAEADKGFLVWCSLSKYSQDTYIGESADYISGELLLEQIR